MTFSLQIMAREISAAVAVCSQVVDTASKIPVLRATRIAVTGNSAEFMATNGDMTVIVKAACEGAGIICIDTPALMAKVATLKPDLPVNFVGDGKSVTITQGRTKWTAPCLAVDDFPIAPMINAEPVLVGVDFINAVTVCSQAADTGGSRPYLEGVYLDGLNICGTNGRQMRIIEHGDKIVPSVIVPKRAADKLVGIFPIGGQLFVTERSCRMVGETATLIWRNVEGTYPTYPAVVKDAISKAANSRTVNPEEFVGAVRRASAIRTSSEKEGSFVNCRLGFDNGEIAVLTRNSDGEEGSDACDCEGIGAAAEIGFNGTFLIAAAESLECSPLEIAYGGPMDPLVMRKAGDNSDIRIVMPRVFK